MSIAAVGAISHEERGWYVRRHDSDGQQHLPW